MKKFALLSVALLGLVAATTTYAADAKDNWTTACAKCHGADGKGQTPIGKKFGAKDYTDATVQAAVTDDAAFKAIKEGFKSADGKVLMKPETKMSDDEMKALVTYMRTLKK